MLSIKCVDTMAYLCVLSAFLCAFVITSNAQYPQPGFVIYPVYNATYNQTQNLGPCQYSNNPEYNSHSVYVGCVSVYDRLVYSQNHFKDSSWLRGRERVIQYPTTGIGLENITSIRIRDRYTNGIGGYTQILAGGVNQKFAKIRMFSPRNRAFDFEVRIYGR